jgi:HlyD family type I secretion membrane fusion protein
MKNLRNYSYRNYVSLALFIILIALIFFARISSAVVSEGVLSYDDAKRTIQHLEGGIVENILVKNGDEVKKNQEIIRLSSIKNIVDKKIIQWKLLSLILQKQLCELEGEKIDKITNIKIDNKIKFLINNFSIEEKNEFTYLLATSQKYLKATINKYINDIKIFDYKKNILFENIDLSRKKLNIISRQIAIYEDFVNKNILSQNTLFDLQRQYFDLFAQILNYQNELKIIDNQKLSFREENIIKISQKIVEVAFEIKINQEQIKIANDIFERSIISSPIDGFIDNLKVFSIGDIVEPSKNIVQIVPKNPELIVVAKIKNIDVDNIHIDQNVEIFLRNFYEKNIPKISGKIFAISKDVIFDENLKDFYFEVKIKIDNNLETIKHEGLLAGMAVDIFIKQQNRNIFSYIFAPIFKSILKSFKEFS